MANFIDKITLEGNKLYSWKGADKTLVGNVAPMDAGKNLLLGFNPTIVNSINNIIVGDNCKIINSNGNTVGANHAELTKVNNISVFGADHKIYEGADYANIVGDAHEVSGYSSMTSGGNNINAAEYGQVHGYNNRLGILTFPNQFSRSTVCGWENICEGTDCFVSGKWIHVFANNVTVFGWGASNDNPAIIREPGIYYVENGIIEKL